MKNRYLKNVTTLKLNPDLCIGCRRCVEVCPHQVFELNNGISQILDKDRCMECGACAKNCAFNAIEVETGVGCALAIITGWLTGAEPNCDCGSGSSDDCC